MKSGRGNLKTEVEGEYSKKGKTEQNRGLLFRV